MDLDQLLSHLQFHIHKEQKSERWAMYRLIVPMLDCARQGLDWTDYFEFNQTSRHGRSQSVDVALLDADSTVRVMIEAKRIGRPVSAELIDKYLEPGMRGVVADGLVWVLCLDGRHEVVRICDEPSRTINAESIGKIVAFIRGADELGPSWGSSAKAYYRGAVRAKRLTKSRDLR